MDIDKDSMRPPPAVRRKRPSAIKCIVVLCSLIGLAVFSTIVFFVGKGAHSVIDKIRNPHQDLYPNASSTEPAIHPFIGKDDTFDVYLTIWARIPDAEVGITEEMEQEARDNFGPALVTIKRMVKQPEREILFDPTERVIFSERMFEKVSRKSRNLHKDINFELPLTRFYDELVYYGDVRAAVVLIPNSDILNHVKEWTGWKPDGALSLPRVDDKTADELGLSGLKRGVLDAMSFSYPLLELHDRNYMNRTIDEDEDEEPGGHVYFPEHGLADSDLSNKDLLIRWKTYQPHLVTKSHVVLVDESRPMLKSAWENRYNTTRTKSCGQDLGLKPTRFNCNRHYRVHGDCEHRIVLETDQGEEVRYGAYLQAMPHMAGPKHLLPLQVKRGVSFDEEIDQKSVEVQHQFTFSSFTPGRLFVFESYWTEPNLPSNATEDRIIHAHDTWEQQAGVIGNRGKDTHPRTRFIIGFLDDIILSLPILLLGIVYWYTRLTSAGVDSIATMIGVSGSALGFIASMYMGARSKTVGWGLFIFFGVLGGFDLAQCFFILKLVLPIAIVWKGWIPKTLTRTRWTKRERATRRLEGKVTWTQRAILALGTFALVYYIERFNIWLVKPLLRLPSDYDDTDLPRSLSALIESAILLAQILQIITNHYSQSFAGLYALEAYMVVIRRLVRLTKFWPWFIGRYESRGGIGGMTVVHMILEVITLWQAWKYPRVEQVVPEDDE